MTDSDQHLSNETQLEFTNNDSNDQNPATDVADMNLSEFRRVVQESQPQDNHLPAPPRAVLKYIPEVTDDFIRNFLLRNNMLKTLEQFEVEWYSRFGSAASRDVPLVPDNYLETAQLSHRIELLERDLREHAELTTTLNKQWRQAKKERDFHKANHSRVVQEKNKLTKVLKQTDRNAADLTPTLEEMKRRCDGLLKQKTVLSLEKDKLAAQVEQLEKRLSEAERRLEGEEGESSTTSGKPKRSKSSQKKENTSSSAARKRGVAAAVSAARTGTSTTKTADGSTTDGFVWPPDERPNTEAAPPSLPSHVTQWSNTHTFTAHAMSVTKIALHPRKPAVASCSDDGTWRLSTVPEGELILSGEGHQNWVAAVAMHPAGTMVATGSGDKTVKLWDFATNSCANTLRSHTDGVWSVDFQETGALLASGSLDTTARVWDVEMGKCRQTLRGHVEAVNAVQWCVGTNILCTGSGDKTVSLWDTRMNCCATTLYGHRSPVLSVSTLPGNQVLASCDTEGTVVVWDIRKLEQKQSFACGPSPANCVTFDGVGEWLAVGSDDSILRLIDLEKETVSELRGHEDGVLCCAFDPAMRFLVSSGSDCTVRYWN